MNCHDCKYKNSVPGSAHICCVHPIVEMPEMKSILMIQLARGVVPVNPTHLLVDGEPCQEWSEYGVRNGWAMYPINFDPVWLNHCKLYETKG